MREKTLKTWTASGAAGPAANTEAALFLTSLTPTAGAGHTSSVVLFLTFLPATAGAGWWWETLRLLTGMLRVGVANTPGRIASKELRLQDCIPNPQPISHTQQHRRPKIKSAWTFLTEDGLFPRGGCLGALPKSVFVLRSWAESHYCCTVVHIIRMILRFSSASYRILEPMSAYHIQHFALVGTRMSHVCCR